MVRLIEQRRQDYEGLEPVFWKRSPHSASKTRCYYRSLLLFARRSLIIVAEDDNVIMGFLIARPIRTPPVYDPGGATVLIDDFCVARPDLWPGVGGKLLQFVQAAALEAPWAQMIVVSAVNDEAKLAFLKAHGLSTVSSWLRKAL